MSGFLRFLTLGVDRGSPDIREESDLYGGLRRSFQKSQTDPTSIGSPWVPLASRNEGAERQSAMPSADNLLCGQGGATITGPADDKNIDGGLGKLFAGAARQTNSLNPGSGSSSISGGGSSA
ncbi:hypothetical protein HOY82DRAFT_535675 [Tuber indicum]|nr:hypothetical protein HOY82DRAFT_535675 [Tuber indicum]